MPEHVALDRLRTLAEANATVTSLIGMGYTGTITPPVIARNVLENPAWYTAYTPYQPEISQGRLEAILNFQTVVTELTGLDVANASLLDEAHRCRRGDDDGAPAVEERITQLLRARRCAPADTRGAAHTGRTDRDRPGRRRHGAVRRARRRRDVRGALFSLPTSTGAVTDWTDAIARVHDVGGLAVVATDPLACVLTATPSDLGADIAVGSAQRFGVPMGFGGPHAAFLAARESAARAMPGRIVGVSTDTAGRPALRLALQTREQHIRREKATSNICTAQVLLANIAGLYAAWHGPDGLRRIAERVQRLASMAAAGLRRGGLTLRHETWFDTLAVERRRCRQCDRGGVGGRVQHPSYRCDHRRSHVRRDIHARHRRRPSSRRSAAYRSRLTSSTARRTGCRPSARRNEDFLTQAVFSRHHSEHDMLRYLRRLSDFDLALDRTMIPLGSCTMKLNATSEMLPITWPEFADIHPFAPADQVAGYTTMIADLEARLATITGYDAVSVQPNAGSQGELAGLLAIRGYHRSRGDVERTVCLIPSSAHGTNAASAVMAGMDVVVVSCDDRGNVDLDGRPGQDRLDR